MNSVPFELCVLLFLGSAATAVVLFILYKLSARVGATALACSLGLDSVADVVQRDRLLSTILASQKTVGSTTDTTADESGAAAQPRAAADAPQAANVQAPRDCDSGA